MHLSSISFDFFFGHCLPQSWFLNVLCMLEDWQRALCFLSSMCSLSLRSSRTPQRVRVGSCLHICSWRCNNEFSWRVLRTSCNSLLHASTVTTGAPSSLHQWALALSQLTGFAKMQALTAPFVKVFESVDRQSESHTPAVIGLQIRSDSYTLTTIGAACALNKVGQKQWQHAYLFHRFHKGRFRFTHAVRWNAGRIRIACHRQV